MSIGIRIKNRRKELGLTQVQLAEPEFTRGFISQIENEITKPPLKTLEIIASKLAVPVHFLIGEENDLSFNLILEQIKITRRLIQLKKYKDASFAIEKIEKGTNIEFYGEVLVLKGFICYEQKQYKETIPFLEEAIVYLKTHDPAILTEVYLKLATCFMNLQQYDKAIEYGFYGHCIIRSSNHEDKLLELNIFHTLAYSHCRRNEHKQGLYFIDQALLISESTKIYYQYGSLKMLKGLAHTYLRDFENGIRFTQEALHFFESSNSTFEIVGCLTNLGILYRYTNAYDLSIDFLKQSLLIAKDTNLDYYIQNNLYELSVTAFESRKDEKTLSFAEEGLIFIKDEKLRGKTLFILGSTHLAIGKWAEAVVFLKQGLEIFEKKQMFKWKAKTLTKLSQLYYKQEDYKSAYTYNQEATEIYESLMEIE